MTFKSDFTFDFNGEFVGKPIEFISTSTVGEVIDSDYLSIEGDVEKGDIGVYDENTNLYVFFPDYKNVEKIEKYSWNTKDGFVYNDEQPLHTYTKTGVYDVSLSISSEIFTFEGKKFRFVHTVNQNVTVRSRFLKFMIDNYPLWEKVKNPALEDMFFSLSKFFDRIYNDITDIFDLVDVERVDPKYFEYLAMTLGHDQYYSNKVGYENDISDFDKYDIYDRIKLGIATKKEILCFRNFLKTSADIFRKKGTEESLEKLFSFFSIEAKAIELWTENWGLTPRGEVNISFSGKEPFRKNKLGLKWEDIRVVGNNNDKGHIENNFNHLLLDNFHKVTKLENDTNVVGTVSTSGVKQNWLEFELEYPINIIKDIRKDNGEPLFDSETIEVNEVYDLIPNDAEKEYSKDIKPTVLLVNPEYLEFGERISVLSEKVEDEIIDSVVATKEEDIKNFDVIVEYYQPNPFNLLDYDRYRRPENEVFVLFRGQKNNKDPYANINEYYRVSVNPLRATMSISKVVQTETAKLGDSLLTQKINLSEDRNNLVYDMLIFNTENEEELKIKPILFDTIYELKVSVIDDLISVWFREKSNADSIQKNIDSNVGGNIWGQKDKEWNALVENLSLDADPSTILSLDIEEEELYSEKYTYISNPGQIGLGGRNTVSEIRNFNVNILDADERVYDNKEKVIDLKPKYLDWLKNQEVTANNFEDTRDSFTKLISGNFVFEQDNLIQMTDDESVALEYMYVDNMDITEDIASRYTITFDENWIEGNFKTKEELLDKIIVPFGDQTGWFMPENRIFPGNSYKNFFGNRNITESVIDETSGIEATRTISNMPGLFGYERNTVLDTYLLEPFDKLSHLEKLTENRYAISNKAKELRQSGKFFGIFGVWEEVCPLSNNFDRFELPDGTNFINRYFNPIVFNSNDGERTVGVRFRHCSDIESIINRVRKDEFQDVQLWGHFTFKLPEDSIRFRPSRYPLETDGSQRLCDVFVPLGALQPLTKNYSLSTEFLHSSNNEGITDIKLNGLFIRLGSDHISYFENELEIRTHHPDENIINNLPIRRFLSAKVELKATISDIESRAETDSIPTTYVFDKNYRKLLSNSENYKWWVPNEVWRIREFETIVPDIRDSVLSGLNWSKDTDTKLFYGKEFTEKPLSLSFKIKDGPLTPNSTYYAKVKFSINYGGGFNTRQLYDSKSAPIRETDVSRIDVVGGKRSRYTDWKSAPAGSCYEMYIPISWFPTQPEEGETLHWANFISESDDNTTITFTPMGMMSWFLNNSQEAGKDVPENLQEFVELTQSWSIQDWNRYFLNEMYIEFISEKVSPNYYKVFDKFTILDLYSVNVGSRIDIKYDSGDVDWEVISKTSLYSRSIDKFVYDVPKEISSFDMWQNKVKSIKISNLIIPPFLYETQRKGIQLKEDRLFSVISGAKLYGKFYYDVLFGGTKIIRKTDDFNINREITWIPYEADETQKYSIVSIGGSEELVFGGEDNLYEIIDVRNQNCFKAFMEKTGLRKSWNKNKANVERDEIINFTSSNHLNINKIFLIGERSNIFDISADIYFDPKLDEMKGYRGKKFDFILNADTETDQETKKIVLDNYYFAGIGNYDFDVALGQSKLDLNSNNVFNTFLAGFGDFRTQNIKTGVWYTLRCIVTKDSVKILFNQKDENEKLVINYITNKSFITDEERYLSGKFEELVYVASGLENMNITYPDKLGEKTNDRFLTNKFSENLIKLFTPAGGMVGFRLFNNYTYVTNVQCVTQSTGERRFGNPSDTTDLTSIIYELKSLGSSGKVDYISETIYGTLIILSENNLYYKIKKQPLALFESNVDRVFLDNDNLVILHKEKGVYVVDGNLQRVKNVYIKDKAFNIDFINNYKKATNRDIQDIFINDGKMNIIFGDIK